MKKTTIAAALMFLSVSANSAPPEDIVRDMTDGRFDFGWGGDGGGNLEAYSKDAFGSDNADRKGQFKFIYGGDAGMGYVAFTHYNGSGVWIDTARIDPHGNLWAKGNVVSMGALKATQVEVADAATIWPDYVFRDDYPLMSIEDLSKHIEENGHLPGIPTAEEIREHGQDLGAMSAKTLEKVEELALYVIQLKKENDALKTELEQLRQRLADDR